MPFFKNTQNKLYFLDEGDDPGVWLPGDCIAISDEEANELQIPSPLTQNEIVISKIVKLESSVTERRIREAILGTDDGWLNSLNDQIEVLRSTLI